MTTFHPIAHPVLSVEAAKAYEARLFQGDENAEWRAMCRAGQAVGDGILRDWTEIGEWPDRARVLVLVGKGHNGGDALLAAQRILSVRRDATARLVFVFGAAALRPLAQRAYRDLVHVAAGRVHVGADWNEGAAEYAAVIDGVFGFQFRPPVDPRVAELFRRVTAAKVALRAAVDLPSGLGDPAVLRADFTYATGVVKAPLLQANAREVVGRLRYLDLGFFDSADAASVEGDHVLTPATLAPLRGLRSALSDKRDYGHLFVVGGSRSFPGAVMMTVRAGLKAGVGLLTAFVPESLVAAYAAHAPEAMWVGWPETPTGGLALEGLHLLWERASRGTALVVGPGMGREAETMALASALLTEVELPAVIDADALQPGVLRGGKSPRILTPHAGEYARLAGDAGLEAFCEEHQVVTVLKGAPTRLSDGRRTCYSLPGGPVLARGGSGDMLAGMIGALIAQQPKDAWGAACTGTLWHGLAADALARERGACAVTATELLDHLPAALRNREEG